MAAYRCVVNATVKYEVPVSVYVELEVPPDKLASGEKYRLNELLHKEAYKAITTNRHHVCSVDLDGWELA